MQNGVGLGLTLALLGSATARGVPYSDALNTVPLAQLFALAALTHEMNGGKFAELNYGERELYETLPEPTLPENFQWPPLHSISS